MPRRLLLITVVVIVASLVVGGLGSLLGRVRTLQAAVTGPRLEAPMLDLTKDGPATAEAGSLFSYTLFLANNGDVTATNLLVTDSLPVGAVYVSGGSLLDDEVEWTLAELPPTTTVLLYFTVTVPITAGVNSVTNESYRVSADGGYSATGGQVVVTAILSPELQIVKSGPASAPAEIPIVYTLSISNSGTSTATALLITDTVPTGAVYQGGGTLIGDQVQWSHPSLGPGAGVAVQFTVTVPAGGAPTITNSEYGVQADNGYGAIGTEAVTTVILEPDLAIIKDGPAAAAPDEAIGYTLTISNSGNLTATNLFITDTLPVGATYVGGGTLVGDEVQWSEAWLGAGAALTAQFTVTVPTGGATSIENGQYGVTADGGYGATGSQTVTTVILLPGLAIAKTGPAEANANQVITYTLTLSNTGNGPAVNVVITDTIPAGASYVSGGTLVGDVVSWTVPLVAGGNSAVAQFSVTVAPGGPTTIVNDDYRATAAGGFVAVGTTAVETTIRMAALSLSKSGPAFSLPGRVITYTLLVTNSGDLAATGLVISDTLPAGATYVSGGTLVGNVVSWTIPSLAGGGAAASVNLFVTAEDEIVNADYAVTAAGGYFAQGNVAVVTRFPRLYLPMVTSEPTGEPNNSCGQAYAIEANALYTNFYPDDMHDWYRFDITSSGHLVVQLDNFVPLEGQIAVYRGNTCATAIFLANNGNPGLNRIVDLGMQPAGRYYLYVSNDGEPNSSTPYHLTVQFKPQ